jgi:Tol biopolymer transport system component
MHDIVDFPSNVVLCTAKGDTICHHYRLVSRRTNQEYTMGEPSSGASPPMSSPGDRLDSWKEIAAFFHRDIKTVQRWEKREAMPVHRHLHDRIGSVYAWSSELHTWSQGRQLRVACVEELEKEPSPISGTARTLPLRSVGIVILLALIASSAYLILHSRGTHHHSPFEAVKTTRLTSTGEAAKAAISPDGRYIAHTRFKSGHEALWVRRVNMMDDVELIPPRNVRYLGIVFSGDSEVVYIVVRNAADASGTLYRIPVIGGSPQKLKENLASPIALSPDGKRFAFVRETTDESVLFTGEFDSESEHKLIARKLPVVLDYPGWSPDGQKIAYTVTDSTIASSAGSNTRIMEVRVAETTERAVSNETWAFIKQLAWMSDGSGLVLSARDRDESGLFHIWRVSYPDGVGRKMTAGLHSQIGVSISTDSRRLVTVEENTSFAIWRVRSTGSQPTLVVSLCGWSAPAWTPDHRIVFEEELDGHRSIWTVDANGANRTQVTFAGNNFDHTVSGNGRRLVWVSDQNGSPALWTMELEGGHPALVTTATGESFPDLSPDGQWIAFTSIGKQHWATLWRVATSGGQPRELNDKLWKRPVISPDNKWIAGFYSDRQLGTQKFPDSLAIVSVDGGPTRKVIHIPSSFETSAGPRWSPDGRELTYVNRGNDGDNIWSQPVDGTAPRQVTQFNGIRLFSFDWSADGKELAFSRGIEAKDVVLVEDAHR